VPSPRAAASYGLLTRHVLGNRAGCRGECGLEASSMTPSNRCWTIGRSASCKNVEQCTSTCSGSVFRSSVSKFHLHPTKPNKRKMITGPQIRAARAMLRWSPGNLASYSKLPLETIRRAESSNGEAPLTMAHENAIRSAFQAAGVEFTNGEAPGVRMRRTPETPPFIREP